MTADAEVFTSRIAEARRLLATVKAARWPSSRDALAAIQYAWDYAGGEMGVYEALASGAMDWTEFDADLMFFGGDPQHEAVVIAEERALDAARAAVSRLAQYQRREAARNVTLAGGAS